MVKKWLDPDGFIICRKCDQTLPRTAQYFHRSVTAAYGLVRVCKICDNKRRNDKEKAKAYHNHPRRCKTCDGFFYASLAAINKAKKKKRYAENLILYCSKKCIRHVGGKHNWSWNGARIGTSNPAAIYSESIIREVKLALKKGLRNSEIAAMLNVKPSTVCAVKANRIWSHIIV